MSKDNEYKVMFQKKNKTEPNKQHSDAQDEQI